MSTATGIFASVRGDVTEHVPDYRFGIREEEVVTQSGLVIPDRRAIVRADTDVPLAIVGSNYKVLTHGEALDPILDALKRKNVKTFQRVALTGGGARMYANIYFPDQEINLTSRTHAGERDNCWPGITVINSLDGTLKFSLEATIYRLMCTNGMRMPTAIASMATTHSKNKNYEDMVEEIIAQTSDTGRFIRLQRWADTILEPDQMATMAQKLVEGDGCLFPARYLPEVTAEIANESKRGIGSVWGLYNAFNSVLEHNLVREKGKFERARMLDDNLYKMFSKEFN